MTLGINKNKILLQGGKNFFAVFFLFFINNRSFIKSYLHITHIPLILLDKTAAVKNLMLF